MKKLRHPSVLTGPVEREKAAKMTRFLTSLGEALVVTVFAAAALAIMGIVIGLLILAVSEIWSQIV